MNIIITGLSAKITRLQMERRNLAESLYIFEKCYKRVDNRKLRSSLKSNIISLSNRISEFDRVISILGIKEEIMTYEI